MTTYTAIPNSDIDPESPITTGLMTLLRDNPIAITERAAGAPTVMVGTANQVDYIAGTRLLVATDGYTTSATSYSSSPTQFSMNFNNAGSGIVVKTQFRIVGGGTGYVLLVRNGATVVGAEQQTTLTTYTNVQFSNVAVADGDRLDVQIRHSNSNSSQYTEVSGVWVECGEVTGVVVGAPPF